MTLVWLEKTFFLWQNKGHLGIFGFQVPILPISQDISYIHPFKGRIGPISLDIIGVSFGTLKRLHHGWNALPTCLDGNVVVVEPTPKNSKVGKWWWKSYFRFSLKYVWRDSPKKRSSGFGGVEPYFLEYKVYVYMHLHGIGVQQTYLSFDPQTRMYNILLCVAHISFFPTHVVPTKYPPHGIQAPRR